MVEFAIDSFMKLKQKTEMIISLSKIELAKSLIAKSSKVKNQIERINNFYKELNCEIKPVEKDVRIILNFIRFSYKFLKLTFSK